MAAMASELSGPRYGYDFVLATTQDSINATMKLYLDGITQKDTYICFTADDDNNNTLVDYNTIWTATNVDAFNIPDKTAATDKRLTALSNANFSAAIKITMGLPSNFDNIGDLPPIITLQNGVDKVGYNVMCSEIVIVQMTYNRRGTAIWQRLAQSDVPNVAWILETAVNMKLDTPIKPGHPSFANLPQTVQDGIKNLSGSMFGVQQLIFDLNNAGLESVPTIAGLDATSPAGTLLTRYFVNGYFKHVAEQGQPVLNYTVIHTPDASSLKPTDLNFAVCPLINQIDPGLQTLDYLCSTAPHTTVPPAVDFTWNWMEDNDAKSYDGVLAINRNTFRDYILPNLLTDAQNDCFVPKTLCKVDGLSVIYNAYATDETPNIKTETPQTGSTIIHLSWSDSSYDEAGLDGALGHIRLSQTYDKTVSVRGNTVTIVTHQIVYLSVKSLATTNSANVTNKINTDVFTLDTDGSGNMVATVKSSLQDNSEHDSADAFSNFFTDVNSIFDAFASRQYTYSPLKPDNIQAFRDFIFPGGQTFTFKNIQFSNSQDLIAQITYADPS